MTYIDRLTQTNSQAHQLWLLVLWLMLDLLPDSPLVCQVYHQECHLDSQDPFLQECPQGKLSFPLTLD